MSTTGILILYAILIVLAFIITFVSYKVNKSNTERLKEEFTYIYLEELEKTKKAISDSNRKALETLVNSITSGEKIMSAEEHHKELMRTFERLRALIKDDLYATMSATGSCRTALYLFHNGQKSSGGVSFIKVSCVGERTMIGSGIKEQILNHSNMPINIFDNMYEKLVENGRYVIMNDAVTMNTARAQFISSSKIRYSYAVSIYDASNNILGFVLAEFDNIYTKNNSDKEYELLKEFADKIGPVLSFTEYADLTINKQ